MAFIKYFIDRKLFTAWNIALMILVLLTIKANADYLTNDLGTAYNAGDYYGADGYWYAVAGSDVTIYFITEKTGINQFIFDVYNDPSCTLTFYSYNCTFNSVSCTIEQCGNVDNNETYHIFNRQCNSNSGIYKAVLHSSFGGNQARLYNYGGHAINIAENNYFRNYNAGVTYTIPLLNRYPNGDLTFDPESLDFYNKSDSVGMFFYQWNVGCYSLPQDSPFTVINSNTSFTQYYNLYANITGYVPIEFINWYPYQSVVNLNDTSDNISFEVSANYPDEVQAYVWYLNGDIVKNTREKFFSINSSILNETSILEVQAENDDCYDFFTHSWTLYKEHNYSPIPYVVIHSYGNVNCSYTDYPNAYFSLNNTDGTFIYNDITDESGLFTINDFVPNGNYTLYCFKGNDMSPKYSYDLAESQIISCILDCDIINSTTTTPTTTLNTTTMPTTTMLSGNYSIPYGNYTPVTFNYTLITMPNYVMNDSNLFPENTTSIINSQIDFLDAAGESVFIIIFVLFMASEFYAAFKKK